MKFINNEIELGLVIEVTCDELSVMNFGCVSDENWLLV